MVPTEGLDKAHFYEVLCVCTRLVLQCELPSLTGAFLTLFLRAPSTPMAMSDLLEVSL